MKDTATNVQLHENETRREADPLNMDVLASVVGPQRPPELGRG